MCILLAMLLASCTAVAESRTREQCIKKMEGADTNVWAAYCAWDYKHSALVTGKDCSIFKANAGQNAKAAALDACAKESSDCTVFDEDGAGCEGRVTKAPTTREECIEEMKGTAGNIWATYCAWKLKYGHSAIVTGRDCTIFKANAGEHAKETALGACSNETTDCAVFDEDGAGCSAPCSAGLWPPLSQSFHANQTMVSVSQSGDGPHVSMEMAGDIHYAIDTEKMNLAMTMRQSVIGVDVDDKPVEQLPPPTEVREVVDMDNRRFAFMERQGNSPAVCRNIVIPKFIPAAAILKRLMDASASLYSCTPREGLSVYSARFPTSAASPFGFRAEVTLDDAGAMLGEDVFTHIDAFGMKAKSHAITKVLESHLHGPGPADLSTDGWGCEDLALAEAEEFLSLWEQRYPLPGAALHLPSVLRGLNVDFAATGTADTGLTGVWFAGVAGFVVGAVGSAVAVAVARRRNALDYGQLLG